MPLAVAAGRPHRARLVPRAVVPDLAGLAVDVDRELVVRVVRHVAQEAAQLKGENGHVQRLERHAAQAGQSQRVLHERLEERVVLVLGGHGQVGRLIGRLPPGHVDQRVVGHQGLEAAQHLRVELDAVVDALGADAGPGAVRAGQGSA